MFRIFLLSFTLLLPLHAAAQSYPAKSVTLIVGSAPGGPIDALARPLAQRLQERFGQPFIVDNRGGAGGNIAAGLVARSVPDGYTLLATIDAPIVVNPALYRDLPYDSLKDLQPVAMLGDGGDIALAVTAGSPVETVQELVESMRKDPARSNYVSSGVGFPSHIVAELFKREAKFDAVHIPAKGAGNAMLQFLSGDISFYLPPVSLAARQLKGGKIRVLAVPAIKRNPLLPDVPTLAEQGYPGVAPVPYWITIFAPAGTPRAVIDTLSSEIRRIGKTAEYREAVNGQGLVPSDLTPDELTKRIASDHAYWMKTTKPLGIEVN